MLKQYPKINYKEHPAFKKFFVSYNYDDLKIDEMISNIDQAIEEVSKVESIEQLHVAFEKEISVCIDRLVDYVKDHMNSFIALELFTKAIDYVKHEVFQSLIRGSLHTKYVEKQCDQSKLEALKKDGYYIANVSEKLKRELYEASRPYYERLKQKAIKYPHLRSHESVKKFSKLSKAINKLVKEANILDVVSNYTQADMKIMGTGIEYSCADHTWYKNPYPDVENYQSDHYYLHLDEADYLPKTLYYLTPVHSVDQGATKFIKGSHTATRSHFVTLFHKGLDKVSVERFFKLDDTYYRPLYKNMELRSFLAKFPARLIGSSHLGDDVIPGSDISKELSENEVTFLSEGLEAIVFDGGNGLHKGANVKVGERLSLQIIYTAKNERLVERLSKKYKLTDKATLIAKQIRELFL